MAARPDLAQRRLALLIATSDYTDPTLRQLRAPGRDASDLAEVLSSPQIGGFAVQTLINARHGELLEAIEDFCADRRLDDQLLIYLSCHGVLDDRGRLYYAATDTQRQRTAATAVAAAWLNERLEDSRARSQIVILDCCHSGAFASGVKGESELALEQRFKPHGRGRIVLTASRGTEYSFEGNQASGIGMQSVFTQAIVDGLRTGNADRDKDGLITVSDIYHYAYYKVKAAEPRQTPELWTYGAEGDVLLAHSIRGAIIEPMPLPDDLRLTLESPRPRIRETAVAVLAELLDTAPPGLVLTARQALEHIAAEDIPRVAAVARAALGASQGIAARAVGNELAEREQREREALQAAERQAKEQARQDAQRQAEEQGRREAAKIGGFERVLASLTYLLPIMALFCLLPLRLGGFRRAVLHKPFIRINAIQAIVLVIIGFVLPVVTIGPAYHSIPGNEYAPAVSQPWFGILITLELIAFFGAAILILLCLFQVIRGRLPSIVILTRMVSRMAAWGAPGTLERFTDGARRVMVLAQEEVRTHKHYYLGTEHILLGLIRERDGVAAQALESHGISLDAVRQQVEEISGQGVQAPSGEIPLTPGAEKALELSLREALQLGYEYIGPEHILLGLIHTGSGVACQVLVKLGVDLNRLRRQVIQLLHG